MAVILTAGVGIGALYVIYRYRIMIASYLSVAANTLAPKPAAQGFMALPAISFVASLLGRISGVSGLFSWLPALGSGVGTVLAAIVTALPKMLNTPVGSFVIAMSLFTPIGYHFGSQIGDPERATIQHHAVTAANHQADIAIAEIKKAADKRVAVAEKLAADATAKNKKDVETKSKK